MNDLTPHLRLPLPHPANDLQSDVLRLRDALTALDDAFEHQRSESAEALAATTQAVSERLEATTQAVADTLETTISETTRQIRRLRLNQLIGLGL